MADMIARANAARLQWAAEGKVPGGVSKDQIETLASKIPIKWPMARAKLETTTHAMMGSITPSDRAMAWDSTNQTMGARPPASGGCGRLLGKPEWHGDARYPHYWPAAHKAYPPIQGYLNPRMMRPKTAAARN